MPPRVTCLHAATSIVRNPSSFRAAFCTTRVALNDFPSRPSPSEPFPGAGVDSSKPEASPFPGAGAQSGRLFDSFTIPDERALQQNAYKSTRGAQRLMYNRQPERPSGEMSRQTAEDIEDLRVKQSLSRQIHRKWKAGDVYAPHDLSDVEMSKWRQKTTPEYDAFDVLDLNPLDMYKNFSMISEYVTTMGRIKPRTETGLRPVNQRRISKAIRRSIGMGLMPSVHRHPEILQKTLARQAAARRTSP